MAELDRYPSPHLAVDVVVLSVVNDQVSVLVDPQSPAGGRALPGRFLRPKKRVADGVAEVLREKTRLDVEPRRATWLGLFDDPRRDDRGWTVSAAFVLGVPERAALDAGLDVEPVTRSGRAAGGRLLFDHDDILAAAVRTVRAEYEERPDPRGFLGERPVTLTELRETHEAVLGERVLRDTFRRRMEPMLRAVGATAMPSGVGRPAQLYVPVRKPGQPARVRLPRAQR